MDSITELFAFKSPNHADGICRIERISLKDGGTVIICEELDENPGQCITNGIETLVPQVCDKYKLKLSAVVWIEHYPVGLKGEDDWDIVTFKVNRRGQIMQPAWRDMTDDDWQELGLQGRVV